MADAKISALTELAAPPAQDDWLLVVDESDTTMAASGTDKKILYRNFGSVPRNATAVNLDVTDSHLGRCIDVTATSVTVTVKDGASGGPNPPTAGGWFEVRSTVASTTVASGGATGVTFRDPTTGSTTTSVVLAQYETVRFTESGDDIWVMSQRYDPDLMAIGKLTSAANKIPYFTGASAAAYLDRDTDTTLAANSDTSLATQKATKAYADAIRTAHGGVYRTVWESASRTTTAAASATTYIIAPFAINQTLFDIGSNAASNYTFGFALAAADYAITGLTTKLRLVVTVGTMNTAPAVTITYTLKPLTISTATIAAGTTAATATATTPAASTFTTVNSGDVSLPSDGFYGVTYTVSGTPSGNFHNEVRVQVRNT